MEFGDLLPAPYPDIDLLIETCHQNAIDAGWWMDPETGCYNYNRNVGELIALIHSEVSEALEGVRTDAMDKHLPYRNSVEVELADVLIRVFDLAGHLKLDLGSAIQEKLDYNKTRADHKAEARMQPGGKKF